MSVKYHNTVKEILELCGVCPDCDGDLKMTGYQDKGVNVAKGERGPIDCEIYGRCLSTKCGSFWKITLTQERDD